MSITSQKETHRYREKTSSYQWGAGKDRGKTGQEIKK